MSISLAYREYTNMALNDSEERTTTSTYRVLCKIKLDKCTRYSVNLLFLDDHLGWYRFPAIKQLEDK